MLFLSMVYEVEIGVVLGAITCVWFRLEYGQSKFLSDCSLFINTPQGNQKLFSVALMLVCSLVLTKVQTDSLFYSLQLSGKCVGCADGSAKHLCVYINHTKSYSTLQLPTSLLHTG